MDIKIRTKQRVSLIECTKKNLGIYGRKPGQELNYVVASEGERVEVLGEYKDEKRALEILENLQDIIEKSLNEGLNGIVIQMPEE